MKITWILAPVKRIASPGNAALIGVMLLFTVGLGAHVGWRGPEAYPLDPVWSLPGGDPVRGQELVVSYGCTGCHVIDGLRAPGGRVGPRLEDLAQQVYVGGVLPNTPENLVAWLRDPRAFSPNTAMPNLGVTEADARDIAAFLYDRPVLPKTDP